MNLKKYLKGLVHRFGYDVRKINNKNSLRISLAQSYSLISLLGFKPQTVIDVGVANGTQELYEAFPDSYFLLIEPLNDFEPQLQAILKRYRGSYILAAAGADTGKVTFNVHQNHLAGSSLFKESMGVEADGREITVPMIKIDDVLLEKNLDGPYLIKVDVEGAELAVLDGAQKTLRKAEVVVLEVSLFYFRKGAPDLYDVLVYMKDRGFVAYDIILGWNRPLDNALGQVDIVFVKKNGQFRQDHSYSTLQQMRELFPTKKV